jgi:hypothetical protein
LAPHDDALRARVAAEPDITLAELQAWLLAERKVKVSIGCLWSRLKFVEIPLKKKSQRAAELIKLLLADATCAARHGPARSWTLCAMHRPPEHRECGCAS